MEIVFSSFSWNTTLLCFFHVIDPAAHEPPAPDNPV